MEQHLYNADSAEKLKELKNNSIDLLATDPPYGLEFMGKNWDKTLPPKQIWEECYRVLKPIICKKQGDKGTNSRYYDLDFWFDNLLTTL